MIHITEEATEFEGALTELIAQLIEAYLHLNKLSELPAEEFDDSFRRGLTAARLLEAGMDAKEVLDVLQ